ncbi:MAG: aminotransferase class I/II-fold pyridoxal phosphate-dependent enzyme [Salinibacter sp.]
MPMTDDVAADFRDTIQEIKNAGTYNEERVITSQQDADIEVEGGRHVINFCANNYLGLANHPDIMEAAKNGVDRYGFGVASVRFICGTQSVHKDLEHALSDFHDTDDTILYNSCFDANTGLFETLLDENDAIISDELNHASIIDGIRLCRADLHV